MIPTTDVIWSPWRKELSSIAHSAADAGEAHLVCRLLLEKKKILRAWPRGRLLDVPAGEGALALRLARLGYDVACCDLYPEIFQLDGLELRSGYLVARLPYEDELFDAVACVEGYENFQYLNNDVSLFQMYSHPC